jgi:hypothetical protein
MPEKNLYKWPKIGPKNTKWPLKDRYMNWCSQSFTSRGKISEYLARFYTLTVHTRK